MAKTGEVISTFRTLIREHSDDSAFSDQELYHLLSTSRSLLFKRKIDKFKTFSAWEYQQFCIPLEEGLSHNCGCIQVGCKVLKSKYKLPRVLTARNKDLINITTLDYTEVPIFKEREIMHAKYDDVLKGKPMAAIIDRGLVIFNQDRWKAVLVSGLWEDLSEWDGKTLCNPFGEESDCFNFLDAEFSIDSELLLPMYEMSLKLLSFPLSLKEDVTNDASNVIRI